MIPPVEARITQEFGLTTFARTTSTYPTPGHLGRDYGSWDGTPVVAPCNGTVDHIGTGSPRAWGYFIRLIDADGRTHIFAHLQPDSAVVAVGDVVTEADRLALSGHSPNWAPHLHWQIIDGGARAMNFSIDVRTLLTPERYTNQALQDYAGLAAARNAIDPAIFQRQINQESRWDMYAHSGANAIGIAQIVPRWHPTVNPWEPYEALDYAARLMAAHHKRFGRIDWALAAYNAGANAVAQAGGVPPFAETENYVRSILENLPEVKDVADATLDNADFWLKAKWEELAQTTIQIVNRAHAGVSPTDEEAAHVNGRYATLISDWSDLLDQERARARGAT